MFMTRSKVFRFVKLEEKGLPGLEDGSRRLKPLLCPRWESHLV